MTLPPQTPVSQTPVSQTPVPQTPVPQTPVSQGATPPAPQHAGPAVVVPGWYTDPLGEAQLRWWDGQRWTTDRLPPAPAPLPPRRPAAWSARTYGYLVDALFLWTISLLVFQPVHRRLTDEVVGLLVSNFATGGGSLLDPSLWWDYGLVQLWAWVALPGVALRVAWDLAWLTRRGATFGHRRAGLLVRRDGAPERERLPGVDTPGLPWRVALVRSLVLRLSAPTGILWLLVVLWPLVDERRRSLADIAAGTWVEGPQ